VGGLVRERVGGRLELQADVCRQREAARDDLSRLRKSKRTEV
jgi:hypothetical protein